MTVRYVDASARTARSLSPRLSQQFRRCLARTSPGRAGVCRDLAADPPHVTEA